MRAWSWSCRNGYRALSRPGCVLQLAAALAEIGRLRLEELRIRRVLLEQGEIRALDRPPRFDYNIVQCLSTSK